MKLTIKKENIEFIKNLLMYAEDDAAILRKIQEYLYMKAEKLQDWEKEQAFRNKLRDAIICLKEVYEKD